MTGFIEIGLSNVAMAALLAIVAASVNRCWRRPALTHALWLLVLVKLITPPLIFVPVFGSGPAAVSNQRSAVSSQQLAIRNQEVAKSEGHGNDPVEVDGFEQFAELPPAAMEIDAPKDPAAAGMVGRKTPNHDVAAALPLAMPDKNDLPTVVEHGVSIPWLLIAEWAWLSGAVGLTLLALVRANLFQRHLRLARPAPAEVIRDAQQLARRMHVRCPKIALLDGVVSPMVWAMGWRSRLLLPAELLGRLSPEQRTALLAHELAHLRRGDPWVRYLEMAVFALYWWCPLVWWARHELREAEEECCDAWVVWVLPGSARTYALALVETVDFLAEARPMLPALASGFGHVHFLRRRLTMIMRGNTPRTLTAFGALAVLGVAALALPLLPGRALNAQPPREKQEPREAKKGDPRVEEVRQLARKLQEMRAQLEKEQMALREKQMELDKHFRNLHEAMEKLGVDAPNIRPPFQPGQGREGPRFQPPGTQKPPQPPESHRGDPRFTPPGPGQGRPDLERRLGDLEKVLHQVLHEIHNLRQELGQRGPGNPNQPRGAAPRPPREGNPGEPRPGRREATPRPEQPETPQGRP